MQNCEVSWHVWHGYIRDLEAFVLLRYKKVKKNKMNLMTNDQREPIIPPAEAVVLSYSSSPGSGV